MAKKKKSKKVPAVAISGWTVTPTGRTKPQITYTTSTNTLSTLIPSYGKFLISGKLNEPKRSITKRKSKKTR